VAQAGEGDDLFWFISIFAAAALVFGIGYWLLADTGPDPGPSEADGFVRMEDLPRLPTHNLSRDLTLPDNPWSGSRAPVVMNYEVNGPLINEDWCDETNAETAWKASREWYDGGLRSIGPGFTEIFSKGKVQGQELDIRIFTGQSAPGERLLTDIDDRVEGTRLIGVDTSVGFWFADGTYGWGRNHHPDGPLAKGLEEFDRANRMVQFPLPPPEKNADGEAQYFREVRCTTGELHGESLGVFRYDMSRQNVTYFVVVIADPGPQGWFGKPLFMRYDDSRGWDMHEHYIHTDRAPSLHVPRSGNAIAFVWQANVFRMNVWDSETGGFRTAFSATIGGTTPWIPLHEIRAQVVDQHSHVTMDLPLSGERQEFEGGWVEYEDKAGNGFFQPGDVLQYQMPTGHTLRLWDTLAQEPAPRTTPAPTPGGPWRP
jgi:hypothetical protein